MRVFNFLIEFDGPLFDTSAAYFAAHQKAATAVSWARLDQARFTRLLKKEGLNTHVLPGAPPVKLAEYHRQLLEAIESDDSLKKLRPQPDLIETLAELNQRGELFLLTLGQNADARRALLTAAIRPVGMEPTARAPSHSHSPMAGSRNSRGLSLRLEQLAGDAGARPRALKALANNNPRTLVIACSDTLVRAADEADLFTVGLTCGPCDESRLHRAGARVVRRDLQSLAEEIRAGAAELIQAGLPPLPLG